ncbi:MAG TPA: DUF5818 domain-containing protein [Terriglobia bacterium]|nr:DUF5818 domain-containing protein [Terriglobia bacterium]
MRRIAQWGLMFFLAAGMALAAPAAQKTFVGSISDSMCGLKHMMPGGDKACTLECVKSGAKFVLADEANKKVYQLSDQDKAKDFAGAKVKVTGTLNGDTIEVSSIEAAK